MNNGQMAPIRYRDYWDIPRIFLVTYADQLFLFDCPFDDLTEDFLDVYYVYKMPPIGEEVLNGSWAELPGQAIACLGTVPVKSVHFDESRKKSIDPGVFTPLIAHAAVAG